MLYWQWHYLEYRYSVWVNIALEARDQLRQRVAWALYQIIPIGVTVENYETEVFLGYYDVFVRNAFGSYRDILKEISYTDIMSMWLSFYGNLSLQYQIEYNGSPVLPDENYARE
eukprot:5689238-Ditylum_brightwellii.AAC.1